MMIYLYIILAGLAGGVLNRLRGGWFVDAINRKTNFFKKRKSLEEKVGQTLKILMSLFTAVCIYLPFWYIGGSFDKYDWIWFVCVWAAALGFGLAPGWGSWYHVGRDKDSVLHNEDWILSEWISFSIYGFKWLPPFNRVNTKVNIIQYRELSQRFNIVESPTTKIRPFEWRRDMELLAMNIRGLNFMVAPMIFIIHMYISYGLVEWYSIFFFLMFVHCCFKFGHMYERGYYINTEDFPYFLKGNTHFGEVISGSTIMSSLCVLLSYLTITL
jgi:hypothetical protein